MSAVLNTVDVMLAEARRIRSAEIDLRIIHRLRIPGTECLQGEEIFAAFWIFRGREYQLPLALSQLILLDYLARHSRVAQSAKQIELGIRSDAFYREHGRNAKCRKALVRQIPRSAVREHIRRLHKAIAFVFHKANLPLDPRRVLVVTETVSNEVGYQLRANCHWTHLDLTARDFQPLWA